MAHVYDLRSESTARTSRLLVLLLQIYEGAPRLRSRLLEPESLEQTIRDRHEPHQRQREQHEVGCATGWDTHMCSDRRVRRAGGGAGVRRRCLLRM